MMRFSWNKLPVELLPMLFDAGYLALVNFRSRCSSITCARRVNEEWWIGGSAGGGLLKKDTAPLARSTQST